MMAPVEEADSSLSEVRSKGAIAFKIVCVFCILLPVVLGIILEQNFLIITRFDFNNYHRVYSILFNMLIVIPLFAVSFFYYRLWMWGLLFVIAVPWTAIVIWAGR